MTTTTTSYTPTTHRNLALVVARAFAGIFGATQVAGVVYFAILAPEEAVWAGPWVDVPVVGLLVVGVLLKLACAIGPGLRPGRRIRLGLVAAGIGIAVTLVKIPVYDEPEGVLFIGLDLALLVLLLLARRSERAL